MENKNEIVKQEAPSPVKITDDIQLSLNRLGRELESHAESGIRIGKELLRLKEITPHGKFGELVEWAYGLKKDSRTNYMNAALKFGKISTRVDFSTRVLIELSRPSVPDSAREQATELDNLTVKQARELSAAHKRIKELESVKTPDLNNLIPGLMKKYKGASITPGTASRLSVLDEEQQELYLMLFNNSTQAEKDKQSAMDEKLKAMEDMARVSRERDEIKRQLEDIAKSDTAKILLDKETEIHQLRKDYDRRIIKERESIGKEASEFHEKRFKEQISALEEERKAAERKKKEAMEKASASWSKYREMESEIEKLKSQLEVDNPTNIDKAREQHIRSMARGFLSSLEDLNLDMEKIGGGMEQSIKTVEKTIEKAEEMLRQLHGYQTAIINI